jgi:hypothetical protein
MKNIDPAVIIALLGAGGLGAFFKDIVEGLWKLRRGVSARETKRRIDVVQQRDEAIERASRAERNVDAMREYTTELRIKLLEMRVPRAEIPQQPDLERTIPKHMLQQIKDQENTNE